MKYLIIFFLLFINFTASTQVKQKLADQHFNRMEYAECVEMYNELAEKTITGKDNNTENVRKAAFSNYKLFQMKEAIHYYKVLDGISEMNENDNEYYIQALRFIGDYKQAEMVITKSQKSYPNNAYFNQLNDELDKFSSLFKDSAGIKVNHTNISSKYGNFGPTYYQNGLVYATESQNAQIHNGQDKWDDIF